MLLGKHMSTKPPHKVCLAGASTDNVSSFEEDIAVYLEKEMATHSSNLAWRIPWTEEPGRLQSMGLQSQAWLSNCHALILAVYQDEQK